ncbi:MAG: replication-associated recombination protein A [bacterium]|jgi:putative ATPase|nr:replication-associated recombination protein A [bacterium]MDD3805587.1 replication-associated recombination protein A [bacterium]MDD4152947.1 replication-associated recombination protein A [bacterium]MDD4558875.1 replication-associated recombination protein A [bacterium]
MDDRALPLSTRMRPARLDDFVGQEHLLAPGRVLRKAIESGRPGSMVLWGPPGCGKTTLSRLIATYTGADFQEFSAVTSGIPDLRKIIAVADKQLSESGVQTILFVDEIHRFNKAQQDAFLPYVEGGTIILVGATTENPRFSLNPPLLSRSRVYKLKPLSVENIIDLVRRAFEYDDLLMSSQLTIDDEALHYLADRASGDGRLALDTLELAANAADKAEKRPFIIQLSLIEEVLQQRSLRYGIDDHYDIISAYIKSLRGSDPDAALYWLAKMLSSGEDPRFIARRLVIQAAEDVGCADPMALIVATAASHAVADIGLPEAGIPLAEATIYVACAPKSNAAYLSLKAAMEAVEKMQPGAVPEHIKGHPQGYLYPHDYPEHFVKQQYMPDNLKGVRFYNPGEFGYEGKLSKRLEKWREAE